MQLRSDIQLTAMMKSLRDVVIPAIDPANRLALEQSQLILGMLNLMARQLPLQWRFDRDELRRLIASAGRLGALDSRDATVVLALAALRDGRAVGEDVLARSLADPAELLDAVRTLREATSELVVAAAGSGDAALGRAIEDEVLTLSKEQLLRDRALVASQGWEPDPAALPAIEALLDAAG